MTYIDIDGQSWYNVTSAVYDPEMECWRYDIVEAYGSGDKSGVREEYLHPVVHSVNATEMRCSLNAAHDELDNLEDALHNALAHMDCMRGCTTFAPMLADIDKLFSEVAAANSIRVGLFNTINKLGVRFEQSVEEANEE